VTATTLTLLHPTVVVTAHSQHVGNRCTELPNDLNNNKSAMGSRNNNSIIKLSVNNHFVAATTSCPPLPITRTTRRLPLAATIFSFLNVLVVCHCCGCLQLLVAGGVIYAFGKRNKEHHQKKNDKATESKTGLLQQSNNNKGKRRELLA
jgi:hypothetical protein